MSRDRGDNFGCLVTLGLAPFFVYGMGALIMHGGPMIVDSLFETETPATDAAEPTFESLFSTVPSWAWQVFLMMFALFLVARVLRVMFSAHKGDISMAPRRGVQLLEPLPSEKARAEYDREKARRDRARRQRERVEYQLKVAADRRAAAARAGREAAKTRRQAKPPVVVPDNPPVQYEGESGWFHTPWNVPDEQGGTR